MVVLRSTVAHIHNTNSRYIYTIVLCIIAGTSIVMGVQRLSRGTTIPISLSDDLSSHFTSILIATTANETLRPFCAGRDHYSSHFTRRVGSGKWVGHGMGWR